MSSAYILSTPTEIGAANLFTFLAERLSSKKSLRVYESEPEKYNTL